MTISPLASSKLANAFAIDGNECGPEIVWVASFFHGIFVFPKNFKFGNGVVSDEEFSLLHLDVRRSRRISRWLWR